MPTMPARCHRATARCTCTVMVIVLTGTECTHRLYRLHGEKPEHLEVAQKTAAFINKNFKDSNGDYVVSVARDGTVKEPASSTSFITTGI